MQRDILRTVTSRAGIWAGMFLALALIAIVMLQNATPAGSQASPDPATDPTPALDTITDQKTMAVEIAFDGRTDVSLAGARVLRSAPRARISDPPLLLLTTYDQEGNVIEEFNGWHPLWMHARDSNGEEHLVVRDEASGMFYFPFSPQLSSITVADYELEQEVADIDLDPAIADFCANNPSDADCATDLAITKADSVDPAIAGEALEYTLTVSNEGANPARSFRVIDTLPVGVTYQGDNTDCVEAPAGTLTCEIDDPLAPGASVDLTFSVMIDADLVYSAGAPVTITNHASVENLAGDDTNAANDSADESTLIKAEADLAIVDFAAVDAPLAILVGDSATVSFDKTVTSYGPSSPMDVAVAATTSADAGLTVSADAGNPTSAPALETGEERTLVETFSLTCDAPGLHTVTISNEIAPQRPDDFDPDLSNNEADVSFEVDCVVPVAINIEPGGYPNTINLRSKQGVVTVAVLTTEVGEYDLPVAFDASTIDAGSVLFGSASSLLNVANPSGASEVHQTGHIEDSYELDEATRDGDVDMVLHFSAPETGLVSGDTEACVYGVFTTAAGETFTFFGCDSIVTVP